MVFGDFAVSLPAQLKVTTPTLTLVQGELDDHFDYFIHIRTEVTA